MKKLSKFAMMLLCVVMFACSDTPAEPEKEPEPDTPEQPENPDTPDEPSKQVVEIAISAPETLTLERRTSSLITITLDVKVTESKAVALTDSIVPEWTCTSSNPDIVTAERVSDTGISVTGTGAGSAEVKIVATAGEAKAEKSVAVTVERGAVKILAIGNSFSQDAVEQYLYELAHDAGIEVVVGNMYIGGCDLDKHLSNMKGNLAAYDYRKVVGGKKTQRGSVRLSEALRDEPWDYISLQQASGKSGRYDTYIALGELVDSVSVAVPDATLVWHQTWAYAANSNHDSFPAYGRDQMTMYKAIIDAARRAVTEHPELKIIIPSGTAIQNGRGTYVGDVFNRDGYHLEVTYGRYTAACTWFEALFGIDVTTNGYAPDKVTDEMARLARAAAHAAVLSPDAVSELDGFSKPQIKEGDLTAPVYVDFGPNAASSAPWNNITSYKSSDTPQWLRDANGDFVSVNLRVAGGFTADYPGVSGENDQAPITVAGIEYPISAWKDGIMVSGTKGGGNVGPATIVVGGLNPAKSYDFSILAVRFNGSHSARLTQYTLTGASETAPQQIYTGLKIGSGSESFANFASVPFDDFVASFAGVKPDASGNVTVNVTGIDTSKAADGHINALVIAPAK